MIVIVMMILMRIHEAVFNQLRMFLKMIMMMLVKMILMMLLKMISGQISFAANRVGVY